MADPRTQVVITAKDETTVGVNGAIANIGRIGGAFTGLANPVSMAVTAVAAASAAIGASIKSAIDTGDQLNKLSQKTGIAVTELSALAYAGELADVNIETLSNGIKKLSVNMAEAATNTNSKAAEAFKLLGVSVKDVQGNLRGADAVLGDLAERFAAMEDGAGKTALAVALFGKSGDALIPFLNQGKKGIAELREEAQKLGLIMTGETAKAAEEFNDNLRKLTLSAGALGRSIAADLVGPLAKFTGLLVEARKEGVGLFGSLAVALRTPDEAAPLDELRGRAATLQGRISSATEAGGFNIKSRVAADRAELARLQKIIAERLKQADDFGPPVAPAEKGKAPAIGEESDAKRAQKEQEARLKRFKELGERNLNDYTSRFADDEAQINSSEAIAKANERSEKAAQKERESVERLRRQYIDLADPLQKYRVQLDEISRLRADGKLTAEQAIEAEWAVNEAMEETKNKMLGIKEAGTDTFGALTDAVRGWGNEFTNTLADMVVTGKANFADLAKSIIRDLARIQIQENITKHLLKAGTNILGNLFSGGSGGGGFNIADSFAGGGYTGNGARSGGLDGQGGFLAMLHPQETVLDHAAGQGAGSVTVQVNFAVGIAQTVRAEVMNLMPQIQAAAKAGVMDARLRGGSTRAAFSG